MGSKQFIVEAAPAASRLLKTFVGEVERRKVCDALAEDEVQRERARGRLARCEGRQGKSSVSLGTR